MKKILLLASALTINLCLTYAQVLWYGDPNMNYLESFYRLSRETGEDGTIKTVTDPVHGKVWEINKPIGSKRTEVARTNGYIPKEGDLVYVGWRMKISIAGTANPNGIAIFQLKSEGNQTQNYPLLMGSDGNSISLIAYDPGTSPQASRAKNLCRKNVNEGNWVSIVLAIKFSDNANIGYVECWFDGVKQDLNGDDANKRVKHRTLDDSNYFKWGAYNEEARPFNITANLDEMRVTKDYASAEPNNYNSTPAVPVTSVTLSPTTLNLKDKQTSQLSAVVLPANASNKAVTYTSSNAAVAIVNAAGLVTAKGAGTANITVKTADGNKIDVSVIKVTSVTAVYNEQQFESLNVFPNPSLSGNFQLNKASNWVVFNSLGIEVNAGYGTYINLSNETKGMYMVKTETEFAKVIFE